MSDDDSTESQPQAAPPDSSPTPAATSPEAGRSGVHIPGWLAGALVVVLALVVGGVGFAIGRTTADDGRGGFRPALVRGAQQNGGQDGNQFPGGPGAQRGGQGQSPNGGGQPDGGAQDGGSQDDGSSQGGP